jgi:SAM-dependent methyltransferase
MASEPDVIRSISDPDVLMLPKEYRSLVNAAARMYFCAGLYPYFFARGKLGHDPVFPALLCRGLLPHRARILDLGCGQGVLGALLVAARRQYESGAWADGWAAPPSEFVLDGIELQPRCAGWAQAALGDRATILVADLRDVALPDADAIVILDVLHYLPPEAQQRVLASVGRALRTGGVLLLRVGDPSARFRYAVTLLADKLSTLVRGQGWPSHYCRPVCEWKRMLERLGFDVTDEPMSQGTPFANALLIAHRR